MSDMLDLATSFRINAWFYLVMSLATWLMLRRPAQWPARVWCLAGVMAGISVWLISLRGVIDDVWTYMVAQPLLLLSYMMYAQALRMDIQRAWSWRWFSALMVLYVVAIAWGFDDRQSWKVTMMVRSANSIALIALTMSALRLIQHERSHNAVLIVIGFALFTVSMVTNTLVTGLGGGSLYALQQGILNHVMGLASFVTVLMIYMGYLGLALERSQRINAELHKVQRQALQSRKQARALTLLDRQRTLAVLANSLGHGIVQPLTATLLNVQLARSMMQTPGNDQHLVRKILEHAVAGLRRSADMIEHIRSFLRPMPTVPGRIAVQAILENALNLLRQELMYRSIDIKVPVSGAEVFVIAEPLPLTQALVQVLRNAMQAVEGCPQRAISLNMHVVGEDVCIEVLDSGPGVPQHLLGPFHASMQPSADWQTGLGLYVTHEILTQFHGRITLDNAASGGARVRLYLPLAPAL